MKNPKDLDNGFTHDGDPRCICTDGREAERDVTEMCNSKVTE